VIAVADWDKSLNFLKHNSQSRNSLSRARIKTAHLSSQS
jgi:hypothetical protein